MKILYSASNNRNSRIQLSRFLQIMDGSEHQIKISAYKISSPKSINIDWTLDALLSIYAPENLSPNNDNLEIYYDQLKQFKPDLIISDLEYFTSYLASLLNIPLWQYSSSLLNYGFKNTFNLGLFKYYAHSLNRDTKHNQPILNLIANSDRNLICSHFGDMDNSPILQSHFEWIRPYHNIGKEAVPCQHYAVANLSDMDANVLDILKQYPDSVVFMPSRTEKYHNIQIKDIDNQEEYYCNLKNSPLFVCQGQSSFLADAFYNGKFSLIYPNYQDNEAIINSHLSEKLELGRIMSKHDDLTDYLTYRVEPSYHNSIKYLHEEIQKL